MLRRLARKLPRPLHSAARKTDEFARGTWAIHRPGWYTSHHAAMRGPEQGMVFAGSDLADGWSGFVDGAIESGLRAAHQVRALLRPGS